MTFKKYSAAVFAVLLATLVTAVYWQTVGFELLSLDDLYYTVKNPIVQGGLTLAAIKEVLTSVQLDNFIPVTLLSYMADVQLFGLGPSGFHLTNTILHLLNTLLVFAFLYRSTDSGWKSFFAAALWAIHPLRAESVAWVAERKDVLAGFFFFAGILAYCEFVKSRRPVLYAFALIAMVLGILSKSIVVVLPAVLLILDFWPLERRREEGFKKLVAEKIPFFTLSILFSALSLFIQKGSFNVQGQKQLPGRLADMATAYFHYLKTTVWPFGLVMDDRNTAVHYTGALALVAGLLIIALSYLAWRARKTTPAVTAGWFWYLAVLFPTSGVILLDFYFVADHFTYLPHLGLMIALVWGAGAAFGNVLKNPKAPAVAGAALVIALSVLCYRQVSLWRDNFTLFGYIDQMSGGKNATAKKSLGVAYFNLGKYQEAYDHYTMASELSPGIKHINGFRGDAAMKLGRHREAAEVYKKELVFSPENKGIAMALVQALIISGDLPGAARQALENIRKWPDDEGARFFLAYFGGEEKARAIAQPGNPGARR